MKTVLVHQLYHTDGTTCAGQTCAWAGMKDHQTYENLGGLEHSHRYMGSHLRHRHDGGDQAHGYFGHPEDPTDPAKHSAILQRTSERTFKMTEPRFRTLITLEVLTTREAFGDDPFMLNDADSIACIDRQEPEEVSPSIYQRLMELHNASRTGWNIEATQPRTDVLSEVLLEMDQTDANWDRAGTGDSDYPTAEDYMADIMWRFARRLHGDGVRIKGGDK